MDEIIIGEKKYISSKQAAKATGYAKDYIGQLCREGRVPARLVGRSWYVLETAIKDHRFGDQKIEKETEAVKSAPSVFSPTWESPRYEASSTEALPSVNRFEETEEKTHEDDSHVSNHLQDSWRAWFDRVGDTEPVALASLTVAAEKQEKEEEEEEAKEETEVEETKEDSSVNVPVRTIYRQPPEELLPRHLTVKTSSDFEEVREQKTYERGRGVIKIIQLSGALLAMVMAILAALGSGYFDKYMISNSQVEIIAGVIFYNR